VSYASWGGGWAKAWCSNISHRRVPFARRAKPGKRFSRIMATRFGRVTSSKSPMFGFAPCSCLLSLNSVRAASFRGASRYIQRTHGWRNNSARRLRSSKGLNISFETMTRNMDTILPPWPPVPKSRSCGHPSAPVPFKKLILAEDGADENHHLGHDSGLRRIIWMK
jgi:hypothetical protein